MNRIFLLAFSFLICISCNKEEKRSFDLLITNASIIDVTKDSILQKKLIGISNDTVQFVGDMNEIEKYEGKETIDAENKYVMPGLWDMHVHFRGGDSLIAENKELLSIFLAHGITTVKDAGGDITPAVLDWKKNIANGNMPGPRIFSSGPKLDGANPAWEGSIKVTMEKEVKNALDSLEGIGVDYVKMYDGSLTKETYYNIIQQAQERGLKTTGHMPLTADLNQAVEYGLDGVEHLYYIVKAGSPLGDSLAKTNLGYGMMPYLIDSFDEEQAKEVYLDLAAAKVSVTPTLHIGKTLSNLLEDDHSNDLLLKYVGEGIQKTYQRRIERAKKAKASGNNMRQKMEQLSNSMIVPMFENGVNVVAGSDSGAFNSYVYPGESLHSELEALVNAGLSPAQALQTSIINGPKFFGLEKYYGSLEKGKIADIIILEGNPLEEIKNTTGIIRILRGNQIYNPRALLEKIKN